MKQQVIINDSCVLKNENDFVLLNNLILTLTDNEVLGTFGAYGGNQINGIYNLCCKKLINAMEDIDVLNLDVDVNFDYGTFKALRDKDFIFKHHINDKDYELNCEWVEQS